MIKAILKLESNFMLTRRFILMVLVLVVAFDVNHAAAQSSRHMTGQIAVDWEMVAKIREEGLQRSGISNTLSYMTDVLGARLTNSRDMKHAQSWVIEEMKQMGLVNVVSEPFMEYGASWDNEYFSLHLLKPDYQPMVGYPIAHTPGTGGKRELEVVIADIRTRQDIESTKGNCADWLYSPVPRRLSIWSVLRRARRAAPMMICAPSSRMPCRRKRIQILIAPDKIHARHEIRMCCQAQIDLPFTYRKALLWFWSPGVAGRVQCADLPDPEPETIVGRGKRR